MGEENTGSHQPLREGLPSRAASATTIPDVDTPWTLLHGGALGDLVLGLQLALRLPGAATATALQVVSRTNPGDLACCRPRIIRQSSEGLGLHWLFGDHDEPPPVRLRELVQAARVLSFLGGPHALVHQRLVELRPAALYGVDPRPRPGVTRHIVDQWQTQLEAQGLLVPKCTHQQPQHRALGVPEELRGRGCARLANALRGPVAAAPGSDGGALDAVLVIHPGSGGRSKCWPLANYVDVARYLAARGHAVAWLLGPVELETWPADDIETIAAEFSVLRNATPDELVVLLAGAAALVANDSGPAHLAALLGTPTVTIFGPTHAAVWRPLGPQVTVLQGDPGQPLDWDLTPAGVAAAVCRTAAAHLPLA